MSIVVTPPFEYYTDLTGKELELGKIFVGIDGLDAQTNPQAVFWDADLTIAAAQPIRTIAGVPDQSGTPSNFFTDGSYSITVLDNNDTLVYSKLNSDGDLITGVTPFNVAPAQFFTLPFEPGSAGNVLVFLDGIVQRADVDFTVSGDVLTFVETIPVGLTTISGVVLAVGVGAGTDISGKVNRAGDEWTGVMTQKAASFTSMRWDRDAGLVWAAGIFTGATGPLVFSQGLVEQARIEPIGIDLAAGQPTTLLTRDLADTRYDQIDVLSSGIAADNTQWVKLLGGKFLMQHAFKELVYTGSADQLTLDWTIPDTLTAPPTASGTIEGTATLAEGNAVGLDELGSIMQVASTDPVNIVRLTVFKHPSAPNFVAGDKVIVRATAEGRYADIASSITDGTQWIKLQGGKFLMQHAFRELIYTGSADQLTGDWNIPITLTDPPTASGTIEGTATLAEGNAVNLNELGSIMQVASTDPVNIVRFTVFKHPGAPNFVAGDKVIVRATAQGRWA